MVKTIPWENGSGSITVNYKGNGNGIITITSDPNDLYQQRQQTVQVSTLIGSIVRNVLVKQEARTPNFMTADGKWFMTADGKYFNVAEL